MKKDKNQKKETVEVRTSSQIEESPEVAITGSPNSAMEINFDVRATHLRTPLLGSLVSLKVPVQSEELLVLGQVATIGTINRWHEDLSLKNYIKLQGRLPHLTEIGDITTGIMQIIGAYRELSEGDHSIYKKVLLPVPPGSGIKIRQVGNELIQAIMENDFGYGYLGNFYGSRNVPAPVYVRHFGDFEEKGNGEAYMGAVFGPTGSGKSVVAASLISLWAHNDKMGILILDPQSEFAENRFARGTSFDFNFHDILKNLSKDRFDPNKDVVPLDAIQLEGASMFVEVLRQKDFFRILGLGSAKVKDADEELSTFLCALENANIWKVTNDWDTTNSIEVRTDRSRRGRREEESRIPFSDAMAEAIARVYAVSQRATKQQEFQGTWTDPRIASVWNATVQLFKPTTPDGKPKVKLLEVIKDCVLKGKIRILDLNPLHIGISQEFKLFLVDFVFRSLKHFSYKYYREDNPGNCLIVLDEAGRFIPQYLGDNVLLRRVCTRLVDSVKEMRKMRCGFLFITQTIAEIQKEIFRNLHFRIYGVGLGVGADSDHIKAREGNDAFELYRTLPDPRLSGTFSFMVSGVLLALGSSGRPMVIEGFSSGGALLDANQHILSQGETPGLESIGEVAT